MSVGPRNDDITRYLRARLSEDGAPEAVDERLQVSGMNGPNTGGLLGGEFCLADCL